MIVQLAFGSLVIIATVVTMTAFIVLAAALARRLEPWLQRSPRLTRRYVALTGATLWQMGALSLAVWIWTWAFLALGAFERVEPALYFTLVCFTTLGFGDVLLSTELRLLSGLCAANGLLLFGLSAAFLMDFVTRLPSPAGPAPRGEHRLTRAP